MVSCFDSQILITVWGGIIALLGGVWAFFTLVLGVRKRYDETRNQLFDTLEKNLKSDSEIVRARALFLWKDLQDQLKALRAALWTFACGLLFMGCFVVLADINALSKVFFGGALFLVSIFPLGGLWKIRNDQAKWDRPRLGAEFERAGIPNPFRVPRNAEALASSQNNSE